ncbi:MAG: DUF6034 family protein [Clostridia bacterium]|nr:DUF6034 family protein [Clostridia bacterium]
MKRLLTVLLAALMLLTLACQPTPEEEPIVNRADSQAQEAIFSTTAPEMRVFPDRWDEEMVINDNIKVVFEASVEAESNVAHPIIEISRTSYDFETVAGIINAAYGNVRLREQEWSYDELLSALQMAQRGYYGGIDDSGEIIWEPYDGQEEEIATLQMQLASTPTVSTYKDFTEENLKLDGYNDFAVGLEDGSDIIISVAGSESEGIRFLWCRKSRDYGIEKENWILQGDGIPNKDGEVGVPFKYVNITQQEAETMAEAFFEQLGQKNFALSSAFKARAVENGEVVSEGWQLEYGHALAGTQGIAYRHYSASGIFETDETAYVLPWEPEEINLYVTENGVESFGWNNIYVIGEEVNPDVEIMPFDKVQTRIRNYFKYALAWTEDAQREAYGSSIVYVTRVALTTSVSQVENQKETAYLVPTWAIFYIGDEWRRLYGDESVLLLNAIDGSLISQYPGEY